MPGAKRRPEDNRRRFQFSSQVLPPCNVRDGRHRPPSSAIQSTDQSLVTYKAYRPNPTAVKGHRRAPASQRGLSPWFPAGALCRTPNGLRVTESGHIPAVLAEAKRRDGRVRNVLPGALIACGAETAGIKPTARWGSLTRADSGRTIISSAESHPAGAGSTTIRPAASRNQTRPAPARGGGRSSASRPRQSPTARGTAIDRSWSVRFRSL